MFDIRKTFQPALRARSSGGLPLEWAFAAAKKQGKGTNAEILEVFGADNLDNALKGVGLITNAAGYNIGASVVPTLRNKLINDMSEIADAVINLKNLEGNRIPYRFAAGRGNPADIANELNNLNDVVF